jgi:uncharacterized membrane protein YedE/YeeE
MRRKLKKELRDQSLHFLWAGATFVAPWLAWRLAMPRGASIGLTVAAGLSLVFLCAREAWQKRKKPGGIFRNWPKLDSIFYAVGAVVGTLVGALATR